MLAAQLSFAPSRREPTHHNPSVTANVQGEVLYTDGKAKVVGCKETGQFRRSSVSRNRSPCSAPGISTQCSS